MKEMHLLVANDNGNSEQDIIINDEIIQQPNGYAKITATQSYEDLNPETVVKNIFDHLLVHINSKSVESGTYLVGNSAIKSGEPFVNLDVGFEGKTNSKIPMVGTLSNIAAYAVKDYFEKEKEFPEKIETTVSMTTALPINEYYEDKENRNRFKNKFEDGIHYVSVFLGNVRVMVEIKFDFVKVLPEAMTALFAIIEDEDGDIRSGSFFKEFNKEYKRNIKGDYFKDKTTLHIDIGEGTTEMPLLEGLNPNPSFSKGFKAGVGHAIESGLEEYKERNQLNTFTRQNFSRVIKDSGHKKHALAMECISDGLETTSEKISRHAKRQLEAANYEIDTVIVYGGGSILLKDKLKSKLNNLIEMHDIELFFIPKEYAVILNALGLNNFVQSKVFDKMKKTEVTS